MKTLKIKGVIGVNLGDGKVHVEHNKLIKVFPSKKAAKESGEYHHDFPLYPCEITIKINE